MKKVNLNLLAGLLGLVAAMGFFLGGKTSFGAVWLAIGTVFITLAAQDGKKK